jgi:hypothetical protein
MTYGARLTGNYRQTATHVAMEQPTKFELVINFRR